MKNSAFYHETKGNDRLYILWNDQHDENGQIEYPENEVEEYVISLGVEFEDFVQIESDYAVASHYGYDNCIIYGIE